MENVKEHPGLSPRLDSGFAGPEANVGSPLYIKEYKIYRNYYKGHMDKIKGEGGGREKREGNSAGLGWRDGEKRHTTVTE